MSRAALLVPVSAVTLAAGSSLAVSAQDAPAGPTDGLYYLQSATTGLNTAASGDVIAQHRPRGDEDRQQWRLRAEDISYLLESADDAGRHLGRVVGSASGPDRRSARLVGCGGAEVRWQVLAQVLAAGGLRSDRPNGGAVRTGPGVRNSPRRPAGIVFRRR